MKNLLVRLRLNSSCVRRGGERRKACLWYQVVRHWRAHNTLLHGGWSGFRLGFWCLLREDNVVWSVGERTEPSRSQRPGFPSPPLARQRFGEIIALASATLQDEDWINYRLHWGCCTVTWSSAGRKSTDTPSVLRLQQDWILSNSIGKESSVSTLFPYFLHVHANAEDKQICFISEVSNIPWFGLINW